jgi:hypothetical protein
MRRLKYSVSELWLMGSVFALVGCGGGEDENGGEGSESQDGTVTEEWAGFCTGTFTKDTAVLDVFDEPMFTALAGEEYLLADLSDTFGARAEFLFLTDVGPDSFVLEPDAEGAWPFTSNCAIGEVVPYYAVFDDVTVFAEEELVTKMCDLSKGSALPSAGSGRGYAYIGSEGSSAVYEVILGPFSEECGGADRGYISVPQTRSFGSTTWLVPFSGLVSPE